MKYYNILFLMLLISCANMGSRQIATSMGSKILIISDIDDTIKVTGLLSKRSTAYYAGMSAYSFLGLNRLYNSYSCTEISSSTDYNRCMKYRSWTRTDNRLVAYVTGAPGRLKMIGDHFIARNEFPVGPSYGRPNTKIHTKDFKIRKISELIQQFNEYKIILIGDNGEADVLVYDEIIKKYPTRILKTYIHYVYDPLIDTDAKSLGPEQTPFYSGIDLAINFYNTNLITENELATIMKVGLKQLKDNLNPLELNEHTVVPRFMGDACKSFLFKNKYWPKVKEGLSNDTNMLQELSSNIKAKISNLKYCKD